MSGYTVEQLAQMLVDKGYQRKWAKAEAERDVAKMNTQIGDYISQTCTICRGTFTDLEMKYHSHPCE